MRAVVPEELPAERRGLVPRTDVLGVTFTTTADGLRRAGDDGEATL